MATTATPTKLKSGAWGARVSGPCQTGDVVTITTRTGKTWDARIAKILWRGDGIAICETGGLGRGSRGSSRRDHAESCGYPCPVDGHVCTPARPCHDCHP